MSLPDETRKSIEDAVANIVNPHLDRLANRIGEQNGRVSKAEQKLQKHDSAIQGNREEIRQLRKAINEIPETTAELVRKELKTVRTEQDAARYRQLRTLGWKIVAGIVTSSALISWLIQGMPTP